MLSLSVLASSRNDRQVSLQIALPRSPSACRRCVFVGSRNSCIADMADSGYVALDFTSVVESARLLHVEGKQTVTYEARLSEPVYGRICSSKNALPPARLTSNPTRKTAFLFGADAISSIVLRNNAYDTLLRLGMTRDYLYYEVVVQKCSSWLFLFKPTACICGDFLVAPATWDGVEAVLRTCYPDALQDFVIHRAQLVGASYQSFEQAAGFKFLETKKTQDASGHHVRSPPHYNYELYRSLPHPRKAWQVRLFLYCELRLLELFSGDGRTCMEDGTVGCEEYFCTNADIAAFDPTQSVLLPLDVQVPVKSDA